MANQIWLVFALLSAVTAAFVAIFGKIGLKGMDANTATAVRAVVMAIFLVGIILIQGKLTQIPSIIKNPDAITFIILSGVAGAASWLFFYLALRYGTVSQVAPMERLSVVFAIILAVVFLGEKVSMQTAAGGVIIAVGAIMIALG